VDREQDMPWRPSRAERQQAVKDDLRRIRGFLTVLVAEAEHLGLPVPANAPEILESLGSWEQQLARVSGPHASRS
jgi:hypothetical protein